MSSWRSDSAPGASAVIDEITAEIAVRAKALVAAGRLSGRSTRKGSRRGSRGSAAKPTRSP